MLLNTDLYPIATYEDSKTSWHYQKSTLIIDNDFEAQFKLT